MKNQLVLVVDFGGQYNQLIVRRVRNLGVYAEMVPADITAEKIREKNPIGIIFTGGPASVFGEDSPKVTEEIYSLGIPLLGICYGMQLIAHQLGGEVVHADASLREYGKTIVNYNKSVIFEGIPTPNQCCMSHTVQVKRAPG